MKEASEESNIKHSVVIIRADSWIVMVVLLYTVPPTAADIALHCRPVTLHKWLLVGNELIDTNQRVVDKIDCSSNWKTNDSTPCARLAQATLDHNHSVLIFCCSKQVKIQHARCKFICMSAKVLGHVFIDFGVAPAQSAVPLTGTMPTYMPCHVLKQVPLLWQLLA